MDRNCLHTTLRCAKSWEGLPHDHDCDYYHYDNDCVLYLCQTKSIYEGKAPLFIYLQFYISTFGGSVVKCSID